MSGGQPHCSLRARECAGLRSACLCPSVRRRNGRAASAPLSSTAALLPCACALLLLVVLCLLVLLPSPFPVSSPLLSSAAHCAIPRRGDAKPSAAHNTRGANTRPETAKETETHGHQEHSGDDAGDEREDRRGWRRCGCVGARVRLSSPVPACSLCCVVCCCSQFSCLP